MRFRLLRPPASCGRSGDPLAGVSDSLRIGIFSLLFGIFLCFPLCAATRFIPEDVVITAFLKPAGQHMQLLIRVPLVAMNEIPFPVRSNGYIDIGGAGTMLPGVARNWIANSIDIYEGDTRLALPQVLDVRVAMPSS